MYLKDTSFFNVDDQPPQGLCVDNAFYLLDPAVGGILLNNLPVARFSGNRMRKPVNFHPFSIESLV